MSSRSSYAPDDLRRALGSGLLSFPVTHTHPDLSFDEAGYRDHVSHLSGFGAAGLFAAGGTGEFPALTHDEVFRVVRATVEANAGASPVVGPAGYGTATAVAMAREVEAAGADGVFLLPPYLNEITQDGLYAHVAAVCRATSLGVVVYHRANMRFTARTVARLVGEFDNLVGFKDGVCDIDLLATLHATHGDRLVYVGGLPTAETYALPYLELGATTYSSAIFNFAPEWAKEFYDRVVARDRDGVYDRLREFVLPYLEIRDRAAGYPVSIVKAGMTAAGRPAGPVRPPLTDLTAGELTELTDLVKKVVRA
ncbi:5-dehydro-4-deoxyglucarate dehydratase [Kineococcus aurantiacus]|uniref:5-dehydro-4-deoxyglucarate dehydratase n=1 Tax=Kineococcus aurantiacus TaxID=37633 RepID=A0A7Y9DJK8_9ACTN|nr:5-dehydro-4-deoxyglucarate dehydratase [Kineococcus aurantiacus]NYD21207.1 5-dehydro-4-deoxyglucarate dehydratase [Kineococcus aurantiacus]